MVSSIGLVQKKTEDGKGREVRDTSDLDRLRIRLRRAGNANKQLHLNRQNNKSASAYWSFVLFFHVL